MFIHQWTFLMYLNVTVVSDNSVNIVPWTIIQVQLLNAY